MESQKGHDQQKDGLPGRIRKGHRHNCPGCEYIGKNLIDHLEKDHPEARERYEKARRGVWVLTDDGGKDDAGDDGVRQEKEKEKKKEEQKKDEAVKTLREELREKEKRIAKLEAYLKEKERRIEDLRETRDKLSDISEKTLRISEKDEAGEEEPRVGGNGNSDGGTGTASEGEAAERIKMGLNEAFEESVEMEEGRN